MDYIFNNNWKEKIASMTEVDDLDIEKTFSDMASGFVANKVGDLMKDEHRIGFEIVKKNDDNTRLLGVFAFKVDKELIFAPVFFLSGEIKGPLLYRCDTKQFLPATKDWASYLIESIETSEGRGISRTRISETAPMVDLDKIMMRPKQASTEDANRLNLPKEDYDHMKEKAISIVKKTKDSDKLKAEEFNAKVTEEFNKLYEKHPISIKKAFTLEFGEDVESGLNEAIAKSATFQVGILKEFMSEPGYGNAAVDAIIKAAEMEGSEKLLEHISALYGTPANMIPDQLTDFEKKATAEPRNLELHFEFTKEAAEYPKQYFKDGFFMFDNRYKEKCCEVTKETLTSVLTSISDTGIYDVLKDDGKFVDGCFCAHITEQGSWPFKKDHTVLPSIDYFESPKTKLSNTIIIDKNGAITITDKAMGIIQTSVEKDTESSPGVAKLSEGEVYVAHSNNASSVIRPFYVNKVKSVDGVQFCNIIPLWPHGCPCFNGAEESIKVHAWKEDGVKVIVNKDTTSNIEKGVFGKDFKFIKLDAKKDVTSLHSTNDSTIGLKVNIIQDIAQGSKVDQWVMDKFDTPSVEVEFDKEASDNFKYRIIDNNTEEKSARLNKLQVMTKLARDLNIYAPQAYDIVDTAEDTGSCKFNLYGFEKLASRIHIVGSPQFTEEFDSTTGIPVQEVQRFVLDTAAEQEFDTRPHVGDAMNPTTATGLPTVTVLTTAPEQLRGIADMYNLPNVFEHGAVGTLADTFDANQLLNKYIPKIMEAIDSLGRIKFLFFWKPNDFQKAYGADDMANMEAEIDSNFEALGELGLKLQKKSDKQKKGQDTTNHELD